MSIDSPIHPRDDEMKEAGWERVSYGMWSPGPKARKELAAFHAQDNGKTRARLQEIYRQICAEDGVDPLL